MSKLDRFLLSESVIGDHVDLKATVLERLWSDNNPILLHIQKTDYGPIPFKIFHSWLQRRGFDEMINHAIEEYNQQYSASGIRLQDKLKFIKHRIKDWNLETRSNDRSRKHDVVSRLNMIDMKIDTDSATEAEREERVRLLQECDEIDRLEALDLAQKARVTWDAEGDENTKFFHGLVNQRRRRQTVQGLLINGEWISTPQHVKLAFHDFYKSKFHDQLPQTQIGPHSAFVSLSALEREELETQEIDYWRRGRLLSHTWTRNRNSKFIPIRSNGSVIPFFLVQ
ncbi:hypothetical protein CTI12_AA085460 [Artemisia annua]|uniref:RNA-directed DNA polymerase, eukaryota, Reverse transcriptase zinc-binding domain protein n=1 Tax=Artemisia annua TaxID=35608 RepID=A0A2U1NH07_ARTAN|nr:hypothetical protein CTI12_AA085460 [Artemisia annua]